jgi:hypothetical protein
VGEANISLGGYYLAINPNFGGNWLPSVAFTVNDAYASFSWSLNASAAITSTANVGSFEAPIPEIQVIATIELNGWFQSFTQSVTFIANGKAGFLK